MFLAQRHASTGFSGPVSNFVSPLGLVVVNLGTMKSARSVIPGLRCLSLGVLLLTAGCSSSNTARGSSGGGNAGTGGKSTGATGGRSTASAGASATGGKSTAGGNAGTGGAASGTAGGVAATGGKASTAGGATATGGRSSTGGNAATGGKASVGGNATTGGKASAGGQAGLCTSALPAGAQPVALTNPTTVGTGTAASCTFSALNTAVTKGGIINFNCGSAPVIIIVTATMNLLTTKDTVIDGGNLVTLDGGNAVQILNYNSANFRALDTRVTLQHLTLINGKTTPTQAIPTAPAPCSQGWNDGEGGALYMRDG